MVVGLGDFWRLPDWLKFIIFLATLFVLNAPIPVLNISIGTAVIKPIIEFPFNIFGFPFSYELFVILIFLSGIVLFIFKYGNPSN